MPRKISEDQTRKQMIDPQLEQADWYLHAAQNVFLQKRHLETADLYDAPAFIGFGQDAVERWFTDKEVEDVVEFANRLAV